ncbi:hypothetical protein EDD38_4728 [Kitasatospora cineracea]|uniref:Alpha/beta hydrolase family protein n=2 Tax=Kitasatospora cineracea TaxID=88074 RepID=A0A3N4S739_9ACTN|nr:hypothetical protein EDD38_4728 [Kitasatospora cineracea]
MRRRRSAGSEPSPSTCVDAYARGFRDAGVRDVTTAVVADAGYFAQEEQPAAVWTLIRDFTGPAVS